MKKKPDAMLTMIVVFIVGLVVSAFSTMSIGSDDTPRSFDRESVSYVDLSVSRY